MKLNAGLVSALAAGAAILVGAFVVAPYLHEKELKTGRGKLQGVLLAGQPPVLVALEVQEFSYEDSDETVWRLSSYSLDGGALLARAIHSPWSSCVPATAERLWCTQSRGEVGVVGVPGLELLHDMAALEQAAGQKLLELGSPLRTTESGALLALGADGRQLQLDPRTLAPSPAGDARAVSQEPRSELFACTIPGGRRQGLCRRDPRGREERFDSGEGFLQPELLASPPARHLLLARTSLDPASAQTELVVLDGSGKELRRVRVLTGTPSLTRAQWVPGTSTVLLSYGAPADVTLALDVESGAERFRVLH